MVETAMMLRKRGIAVSLYTAPRHYDEPVGPGGERFSRLLALYCLETVVTEDVNVALAPPEVMLTDLGLGFGEAWDFGKPLLDAFGGRLLDVMTIPLPKYRGGAHLTWAVLQECTKWGVALQQVTENTKQGEFDDGVIVFQCEYQVPWELYTPADWFRHTVACDLEAMKEFFDLIDTGHAFEVGFAEESESLFFPRLKTVENGFVDWSWDGNEILNWIHAFDTPYIGASTTHNGHVVQLRGASMVNGTFHPYAAGLVIRKDDAVHIATRGGTLTIQAVVCDGKPINDQITLGSRFVTSQARLERAKFYRPDYAPTGDVAT